MDRMRYDVLIIGGGIIGCSISSFLSDKGLKIILMEKEALGAGSTSRSLGGFRHLVFSCGKCAIIN
jgi:glycine/D-amino acid oxidase-like deaminating enzyme